MLYSHPDKKLVDHLKNVCEIGMHFYSLEKLNFGFDDKLIEITLRNTLLLHDFAKATTYFQKYLFLKTCNEEIIEINELKNHALLSALYASYKINMETENNILTLISFSSILKHHGDLENWDDIFFIDRKKVEILKKQYFSINFKDLEEINLTKYNWEDLFNFLENLWILEQETKKSFDYFFLHKYIFSILVFSDKNDAIFGKNFDTPNLPKNSNKFIYNYKKYKLKNTNSKDILNILRNKFFEKAIEKVKECQKIPDIIFINMPTGFGKTLTGLQISLELLNKDKTLNKIIYAVPFMSIIDQNEFIINEIFEINNFKSKDYFIKHHHLVEPKINNGDEVIEGLRGQFLIENWNKPIILTTFWQIFYTIFSGDNKINRKFHNFTGSVVILDEIQTIPIKYWKIIRDVLIFLTNKMNCKIIYMTATMPLIFTESEKSNYIEISFNNLDKSLMKLINRYEINIINGLNSIDQETIFSHIEKEMATKKDKNFLFVLNTIKESIIFYQKIKEIKNVDDQIFYLSTNIIPKDRKNIINEIKEKLNSKKQGRTILVSTQLIEAGVDLDFDIIYRDFSQLDSIVQTSGRCNRNNREKGIIYLFNLKDINNRCFYSYIYDDLSIYPTKELLSNKEKIEEKDILNQLNNYYNLIQKRISDDSYMNLKKHIEDMKFKDIQEEFKIIEDSPSALVFVVKDDKSKNLLDNYYKIIRNFSNFERKNEFFKIKSSFYEYILSININNNNLEILSNFENIGNFFILSNDKVDIFYDNEIGFYNKFNQFY